MLRRTERAAAALGVYASLVVWLTWPLGAHLATRLPAACRFDALYGIWALAWNTHALTTAPWRLLDANIYHPAPHALLYGPSAFGLLPYFAPTFVLTGNPALSMNLAFLVCIALTAWGLHRVVVRWTGSELAGLVAGWALLTTKPTLAMVSTPTYLSLLYFPWVMALVALPALRLGQTLALLVLIALQAVTDPVYIAPAIAAPVAVVGLGRALRRDRRASGLQLLGVLAFAFVLQGPLYAAYWLAHRAAEGGPWAGGTRLDLLPPALTPLLAPLSVAGRALGFLTVPWPIGTTAVYTGLALIVAGALCRRAAPSPRRDCARRGWVHGAVWAVVGLVISTPVVVLFGWRPLPNPLFVLIGHVAPGVLDVVRIPIRLNVAANMGLAALAGVGFAECDRWLRARVPGRGLALFLLVAAAIYAERLAGVGSIYRLQEAIRADSSVVRALREGSGPVLELPFRLELQTQAMYRSIFHWRPLLNGYGSYWPPGYAARARLGERLPDEQALAALRREAGLETVVVHAGKDRERGQEWRTLAERGGRGDLRLRLREGDDLVFEVVGAAARGETVTDRTADRLP